MLKICLRYYRYYWMLYHIFLSNAWYHGNVSMIVSPFMHFLSIVIVRYTIIIDFTIAKTMCVPLKYRKLLHFSLPLFISVSVGNLMVFLGFCFWFLWGFFFVSSCRLICYFVLCSFSFWHVLAFSCFNFRFLLARCTFFLILDK